MQPFKITKMSKSKDANAAVEILEYLNVQNRPYSAIDVFNNLHKKFGKTLVVRTLEDLGKQGTIKEKVYGKQKVYYADQSQFPDVDEKEMASNETQIKDVTECLEKSRNGLKSLERELSSLNSALTTEEAEQRLAQLTKECNEKQERLQGIKSAANHVTPEEKDTIYAAQAKYVKQWRKRKRMATDIFDAVLEGYPKSKKDFYEEIGIETDEEYKATIPNIR